MCAVCVVNAANDKVAPEKVAGWSLYQGREYYFCSDDCKKAFDADPEAYIAPALPRPAPAFAVQNLQGQEVTLEAQRGKVVLLYLWATWCKPCHKLMPELEKLHAEFGERGFVVMGISTDEPEQAEKLVGKFLRKNKISYPIYLDVREPAAWSALHVSAIAAMFLVDRDGQIIQQWSGKIDAKEIRAAVQTALGS